MSVREAKPGADFPAQCPERHIELDGKFCLGLGAGEVTDADEAIRWWESLRHFLLCQSVARQTKVWPDAYALDHGDAGEHHAHALDLAGQLGIDQEYARAHADEASWITDRETKLVHRDGRAINARSPCPLACTWRRRGRTVPRLRADCERRDQLIALVRTERARRAAFKKYWQTMRDLGVQCCGTMRDCELRKGTV